jgi:hypothetical protein
MGVSQDKKVEKNMNKGDFKKALLKISFCLLSTMEFR